MDVGGDQPAGILMRSHPVVHAVGPAVYVNVMVMPHEPDTTCDGDTARLPSPTLGVFVGVAVGVAGIIFKTGAGTTAEVASPSLSAPTVIAVSPLPSMKAPGPYVMSPYMTVMVPVFACRPLTFISMSLPIITLPYSVPPVTETENAPGALSIRLGGDQPDGMVILSVPYDGAAAQARLPAVYVNVSWFPAVFAYAVRGLKVTLPTLP